MNPHNCTSLTGRISNDPVFLRRNADNVEFAVRFMLAVNRNYENDGTKKVDFIPIRYEGINRMTFAHKLKRGDVVSVGGALRSYPHKVIENNEEKMKTDIYLLAEDISYPPYTIAQ